MGQLHSAPYVVSEDSSIGPEGFTVKRRIGMADQVALPSAQRTAPTSTVLLNEGRCTSLQQRRCFPRGTILRESTRKLPAAYGLTLEMGLMSFLPYSFGQAVPGPSFAGRVGV